MRSSLRRIWVPISLVLAITSGCKNDPTSPEVGTFTINPEPNSISAPWQVSGPQSYALAGTGDMTFANMTAGNYTVTWGAVPGWIAPNPEAVTQTLAANGSLVFTGTYTVALGTVTIDAEPDSISAPWELVGPGGYSNSGAGDATIHDLAVGDYTLTWGAMTSWTAPTTRVVTQTLAASGSLTFTGTYLARTGTIAVHVQPTSLSAPWHLSGPYGYVLDGIGEATLSNRLVGSYTMTWGDVDGYATPPEETSDLDESATLTIVGAYSELGLPFPDTEDKLVSNFQNIYETMDYSGFLKIMHPDFACILQQSTLNTFPDVGTTLDVWEERRIQARMFSKQDVADPNGNLVPAVQTIQFQTFQRVGVWATSPANDQIPNARNAIYSVQFLFDRGQNYSTLKVTGTIRFYVTSRDSLVGGVVKPYFQMVGQADLTDDPPAEKPAETTSWGSVKALFR